MLLSIVIPVYNERHTLGAVVSRASSVLPDVSKEIIVVDDFSRDGTREWLKENFPDGPRSGASLNVDDSGNLVFDPLTSGIEVTVRPLYHDYNKGKGGSLQTGFSAVTGDVIVIQDADLEYDPQDWGPMYELIVLRKVA